MFQNFVYYEIFKKIKWYATNNYLCFNASFTGGS